MDGKRLSDLMEKAKTTFREHAYNGGVIPKVEKESLGIFKSALIMVKYGMGGKMGERDINLLLSETMNEKFAGRGSDVIDVLNGSFIQNVKITVSNEVPTAAITIDENFKTLLSGKPYKILMNEDFIRLRTPEEMLAILYHENGHALRLHLAFSAAEKEAEDIREKLVSLNGNPEYVKRASTVLDVMAKLSSQRNANGLNEDERKIVAKYAQWFFNMVNVAMDGEINGLTAKRDNLDRPVGKLISDIPEWSMFVDSIADTIEKGYEILKENGLSETDLRPIRNYLKETEAIVNELRFGKFKYEDALAILLYANAAKEELEERLGRPLTTVLKVTKPNGDAPSLQDYVKRNVRSNYPIGGDPFPDSPFGVPENWTKERETYKGFETLRMELAQKETERFVTTEKFEELLDVVESEGYYDVRKMFEIFGSKTLKDSVGAIVANVAYEAALKEKGRVIEYTKVDIVKHVELAGGTVDGSGNLEEFFSNMRETEIRESLKSFLNKSRFDPNALLKYFPETKTVFEKTFSKISIDEKRAEELVKAMEAKKTENPLFDDGKEKTAFNPDLAYAVVYGEPVRNELKKREDFEEIEKTAQWVTRRMPPSAKSISDIVDYMDGETVAAAVYLFTMFDVEERLKKRTPLQFETPDANRAQPGMGNAGTGHGEAENEKEEDAQEGEERKNDGNGEKETKGVDKERDGDGEEKDAGKRRPKPVLKKPGSVDSHEKMKNDEGDGSLDKNAKDIIDEELEKTAKEVVERVEREYENEGNGRAENSRGDFVKDTLDRIRKSAVRRNAKKERMVVSPKDFMEKFVKSTFREFKESERGPLGKIPLIVNRKTRPFGVNTRREVKKTKPTTYFVVDTSGSMSKEDLKRAVKQIIASNVMDDTDVFVAMGDTTASKAIYVPRNAGEKELENLFEVYGGGGTYMTPIIETCIKDFEKRYESEEKENLMNVYVLTDGGIERKFDFDPQTDENFKKYVNVFGLGITSKRYVVTFDKENFLEKYGKHVNFVLGVYGDPQCLVYKKGKNKPKKKRLYKGEPTFQGPDKN